MNTLILGNADIITPSPEEGERVVRINKGVVDSCNVWVCSFQSRNLKKEYERIASGKFDSIWLLDGRYSVENRIENVPNKFKGLVEYVMPQKCYKEMIRWMGYETPTAGLCALYKLMLEGDRGRLRIGGFDCGITKNRYAYNDMLDVHNKAEERRVFDKLVRELYGTMTVQEFV